MSLLDPTNRLACSTFLILAAGMCRWTRGAEVEVTPSPAGFSVHVDGELFTEVDVRNYTKPICYPIFAPGQVPMTRNYPMKPGVEGEATDHHHHQSMWFAHGDINGVSFWDDHGRIDFDRLLEKSDDSVTFANRYLDPDGKVICTDRTMLRFGKVPGGRTIDWDVTIVASHGDLVFGDTKEGMAAVRTHPNLRLRNDADRGVTTANGQAVNSTGVTGTDVWGKRAEWVDYFGVIDDHLVGIAIFDHPQNLRHPTWWHARDYGLIAANPFGIRDFGGQNSGDYHLPAGQELRFRYRFVFHQGNTQEARISALYRQFADPADGADD